VFAEGYGGEAHTIMPSRITGLSYTTPAMSGVTVTVQHGSAHGNRVDRQSAADASDGFRKNKEARTGINAQYTAGPLYLGAAYESTEILKVANAAATTNAYGGTVATGTAADRTEKAWTVAATYNLGFAEIRAMIVERDNGATTPVKTSGNGLGVTVPMGALALGAMLTNQKATSAGATTQDLSGHQLNVRYNLSKRTNVYLHHGTDNDTGSSVTSTTQAKRTRTVAGVVHTF
jgi:predicted porin